MHHKVIKYQAHATDDKGYCSYTEEDNQTWNTLYQRQIKTIENRACNEFLDGLSILNMSSNQIPQLPDINEKLQQCTGWQVKPVPALIPSETFFAMLAEKQFPAATFIRTQEELDYLQEPDIFHEIFGHCPLLTNPCYASFVENYGKLCLTVNAKQRSKLLRLFWLTIEFGLITTNQGTKIYGGGILSSHSETAYALESTVAKRLPFNLLDILRTPYRIDIKQPIYYILDSLSNLYDLLSMNILETVDQAIMLGDFQKSWGE